MAVTIEDQLALLLEGMARIDRKLDELRAERQHQGGRWGTRAEAARHFAVSIDTVDAWIRSGALRAERRGPEPTERFDKLGRRIDRRLVRVWVAGPPRTGAEVARLAAEARGR